MIFRRQSIFNHIELKQAEERKRENKRKEGEHKKKEGRDKKFKLVLKEVNVCVDT